MVFPETDFFYLICLLIHAIININFINLSVHKFGKTWPKVHFTQSAFSCLKLTIETVEQGVKYV